MMKRVRKNNPSLFDLVLFLAFTSFAFGAFLLTDMADAAGAVISLLLLSLTCLAMVLSR